MPTRHMPQRSCIVCGAKRAKRELFRVVRTPAGRCRVDETGKAIGRGAYLCYQDACWYAALRGERLAKALRGEVGCEDREDLAGFASSLRASGSALTAPGRGRTNG